MNQLARILIWTSLFFSLTSCSDQKSPRTGDELKSTVYNEITIIDGLPDNIQGCNCTLARTKEDFEEEKFIYLESYGKIDPEKNIAMVSLDGKIIVYPRKQPPSGLEILVLYESKGGGKSDPEGTVRRGKLVVKQQNGATLKEHFYGFCVC
jgi:hypothetical protein